MGRLLVAFLLFGCASSRSPGALEGDAGAFEPGRASAVLVLGGRCPTWTSDEADVVMTRAGLEGAFSQPMVGYSVAFGLDFEATRLAPGTHEVAGTLVYEDDQVVEFVPSETSTVREAWLEAQHERGSSGRSERIELVGTLDIDDAPGRVAGTLEVELVGDIPPLQPGCGGGGTLSVSFDQPR